MSVSEENTFMKYYSMIETELALAENQNKNSRVMNSHPYSTIQFIYRYNYATPF